MGEGGRVGGRLVAEDSVTRPSMICGPRLGICICVLGPDHAPDVRWFADLMARERAARNGDAWPGELSCRLSIITPRLCPLATECRQVSAAAPSLSQLPSALQTDAERRVQASPKCMPRRSATRLPKSAPTVGGCTANSSGGAKPRAMV